MPLSLTARILQTPEPIYTIYVTHKSCAFVAIKFIIRIFEHFRDRIFESYFSNDPSSKRLEWIVSFFCVYNTVAR